MKFRLIWDDRSPTVQRRPTKPEDIDWDVHIKDIVGTPDDFLDAVLEILSYDRSDLQHFDFEGIEDNPLEQAKKLIEWDDDPTDGSPTFLYVSVDGKDTLLGFPYEAMDHLDLENCTESELKKALKQDILDQMSYNL